MVSQGTAKHSSQSTMIIKKVIARSDKRTRRNTSTSSRPNSFPFTDPLVSSQPSGSSAGPASSVAPSSAYAASRIKLYLSTVFPCNATLAACIHLNIFFKASCHQKKFQINRDGWIIYMCIDTDSRIVRSKHPFLQQVHLQGILEILRSALSLKRRRKKVGLVVFPVDVGWEG